MPFPIYPVVVVHVLVAFITLVCSVHNEATVVSNDHSHHNHYDSNENNGFQLPLPPWFKEGYNQYRLKRRPDIATRRRPPIVLVEPLLGTAKIPYHDR